MKNIILTLFIPLLFGCQNVTEAQTYGEIVTVEQFESKINDENIQLIDVRTPKEYEEGHIGHATNMNVLDTENFEQDIEKLDKSEPVYLYCKSGRRSQRAAQILEEKGFETIIDLEGGYQAWQEEHAN